MLAVVIQGRNGYIKQFMLSCLPAYSKFFYSKNI